jgi:hypothetical protein
MVAPRSRILRISVIASLISPGVRPDDSRHRIGCDSLQLRHDGRQIAGRMFGVDQQPVEAGAGKQFDAVGAGKRAPESDLLLAVHQGMLEVVSWMFHFDLSKMKCRSLQAGHNPHGSCPLLPRPLAV